MLEHGLIAIEMTFSARLFSGRAYQNWSDDKRESEDLIVRRRAAVRRVVGIKD